MNCKFFGICGGCSLYNMDYEAQLGKKIESVAPFFNKKGEIFKSADVNFRSKAEFKLYKDASGISYAMRNGKNFVKIDSCQIVSYNITHTMEALLPLLWSEDILKDRLFEAHFLDGEKLLLSLIYHKALDNDWMQAAKRVADRLDINIVGRSRGQKLVIGNDYIDTVIAGFTYRFSENGFSQPNRIINEQMLNWAIEASKNSEGDLLEAYCGSGNFTIALAQNFNKVLATEISTPAIALAQHNAAINNISNIKFARLSGAEFASALNRERKFNRLSDTNLDDYNFKTIFVDPPRAGLDAPSRAFAQKWDTIIYISCSPQTLRQDLDTLEQSHYIEKLAFFDQFPYTNHLECGVVLKRKG